MDKQKQTGIRITLSDTPEGIQLGVKYLGDTDTEDTPARVVGDASVRLIRKILRKTMIEMEGKNHG